MEPTATFHNYRIFIVSNRNVHRQLSYIYDFSKLFPLKMSDKRDYKFLS